MALLGASEMRDIWVKKNIGVTEIFVERITEILINGIRDNSGKSNFHVPWTNFDHETIR